MVSLGGSLLYELMRKRRLRMGYGQEPRGASSCAVSDSAKSHAATKEFQRTHLNPVPGGTSPAASGVRPIPLGG